MISDDRVRCIIDTLRKEQKAAIYSLIEGPRNQSDGFQDDLNIAIDRWVFSDLIILLQHTKGADDQ
jgi:hypothetical protein